MIQFFSKYFDLIKLTIFSILFSQQYDIIA